MKPGIDPKVDLIFRILFGVQANLELLLSLLNAVLGLQGDDRLNWIEIRNPYNDKEKFDGKLSILDIKARDKRGRQYNIEMQMTAEVHEETRGVGGCAGYLVFLSDPWRRSGHGQSARAP